MKNQLALGLVGIALAVSPAFGLMDRTPINVVVDVSPAGHRTGVPAAGHPLYYFPVIQPYQEMGGVYAGEKAPPAPAEIAHTLATALAKEGYFVIDPANPARAKPDMFLVIDYGSINPEYNSEGGRHGLGASVVGDYTMLAMVGGAHFGPLGDLNTWPALLDVDLGRSYYFFMVSAFDFNTYRATGVKRLLWQAKMSAPGNHGYFRDVVKPMILAGVPWFGRQSMAGVDQLLPDGHIEIGQPIVKEFPATH
ncbi:MAG TPA: hypothetical protein VFE31_07355 [Opitutaceae bacterium]|jgi:hypothetical protein|nr:hypothetical protein [Opitutaceae bacterium]